MDGWHLMADGECDDARDRTDSPPEEVDCWSSAWPHSALWVLLWPRLSPHGAPWGLGTRQGAWVGAARRRLLGLQPKAPAQFTRGGTTLWTGPVKRRSPALPPQWVDNCPLGPLGEQGGAVGTVQGFSRAAPVPLPRLPDLALVDGDQGLQGSWGSAFGRTVGPMRADSQTAIRHPPNRGHRHTGGGGGG